MADIGQALSAEGLTCAVHEFNLTLLKSSLDDAKADVNIWSIYAAGKFFHSSVVEALTCKVRHFASKLTSTAIRQSLSRIDRRTAPRQDRWALALVHDASSEVLQRPLSLLFFTSQGKTYEDLFKKFVREGVLPLGVYRTEGHLSSLLPYVYTNPAPDAILLEGEIVFVIAQSAP